MGDTILVLIALGVVIFFVGVAVFEWLWNITMPEQFGLKPIRYWVAFRLLVIAAFLTSGGFISFKAG